MLQQLKLILHGGLAEVLTVLYRLAEVLTVLFRLAEVLAPR